MSTDKRQTNDPMRVATLVSSISRRAGGLFYSVRNLNCAIRQCGIDISVFSLRDRFTNRDRLLWDDIPVTTCNASRIAGFGFSPDLKQQVFLTSVELLHQHGIWMYPSCIALRWSKFIRKPVVISPRGMLDSWALRNSAWKKKVAGWLYENRNLHSAACIHALCESEYESIRAYGLSNPVAIIPNGIDIPEVDRVLPAPWQGQNPKDKKVMLFLGRIHPKKGLANLMKAWSKVKPKEWILAIAGWDQGGHEKQLKELVTESGLTEDIIFLGPVFNDLKQACLQNASAFTLTSFSEGLPMSVLEAWSYGLPVLMTKFCNIPEGFEANAAIEIQPEPDSIAEGLKNFLNLHESARKQIGRNGLELVKYKFTWPKIAAQMVDVYKWILGQNEKPDCVRLD